MNITVYLGSAYGNDPDFKTKIIELGTWIAKNNHTLVFGGSKTGLMGELANSTLNAGGKVIGVEAQMLWMKVSTWIILPSCTLKKILPIEEQ